jgi:hypothetical protein
MRFHLCHDGDVCIFEMLMLVGAVVVLVRIIMMNVGCGWALDSLRRMLNAPPGQIWRIGAIWNSKSQILLTTQKGQTGHLIFLASSCQK